MGHAKPVFCYLGRVLFGVVSFRFEAHERLVYRDLVKRVVLLGKHFFPILEKIICISVETCRR